MTIGVAILGLGFMGRTHARAYQATAAAGLPCQLRAACTLPEPEPAAPAGNLGPPDPGPLFAPGEVRLHDSPQSLAADPDIHLVSICTPTDTHTALATLLLRAGKHILLEKPVALRSGDIPPLIETAAAATRLCIPAMCMRFWPGWDWLKARARDRSLGELRSLTLQRLGARPQWNTGFYHNPARTGGALFDLHIHDADIVHWLVGPPAAVTSRGHHDHLTTLYHYPSLRGPISAEGGWLDTPGFPFRMRYTAEFDHAAADWDLARAEPTRLLLTDRAGTRPIPLPPHTGYDGEIRATLNALTTGDTAALPTLAEALQVTRLLEAERQSLESGREVKL
ncbi:MAG: Gfo/Idh/MocA family oxidoreductase [Phycisphaerales bacterium]